MSHHPSYTLAGLCAAGGIAGFVKARSYPSLAAGLGVGALYGAAGYLIQQNKDYGHETAVAASAILGGAMIPRALRSRKPLPVSLSLISLTAGTFYAKKVYDYL
ncbi:transmembrane proteins 14C-domain-containing protein [Mycotypha africana]|uniref:transmembrane proteins 14C-domain-containing protein n=1 Tax=Mycotypha africana TaxID=64632 RepID=UPI0023008D9B|nr:transmembrane proteins 14C-domain-containing protein [Mycotypha africana]KAI8981707.1 transmembrane proteins 14C-domain-containing protein [Mycotypha africana]